MHILTVLYLLFHKINLSSPRCKTVFLCIIFLILLSLNPQATSHAQEENTPDYKISPKAQLTLDSNYLEKRERELTIKQGENQVIKKQLYESVRKQRRLRAMLVYTAITLSVLLLGGVIFLNYWQGRRKTK